MVSGLLVDLLVIALLLAGVWQFRTPPGARRGNWTAAVALVVATVVVLWRHGLESVPLVVIVGLLGIGLGVWVALRATMLQIPALVAFQHGMGGAAALLVSFVELTRDATKAAITPPEVAALLGLIVGAGTFSGSLIAAGKLDRRLPQTPVSLPRHDAMLLCLALLVVAAGIVAALAKDIALLSTVLVVVVALSIAIGALFAIRIGGADMPVLISFLNATAGVAAALCGVAIGNRLLIACGATVAASGSILTHVMCRGMNRGLTSIFAGTRSSAPPAGAAPAGASHSRPEPAAPAPVSVKTSAAPTDVSSNGDPYNHAATLLREARRIIIIPGYGMALAEAQEGVVKLAEQLLEQGKSVKFAVHPVAGRMPGHMHVLLAEADVDYSLLFELKDVNHEFAETDVALVVGACDVVNPAAIERPDTPISGMPILNAHEARHVIVCNLDERPGYSGVENPLYKNPKTVLLFGDAQESVEKLREGLSPAPTDVSSNGDQYNRAATLLREARRIIIIPGYGMALAEAQESVVKLAERLLEQGKSVKFAVHPVAGRMPGHMHVLLAEADVDYSLLFELKDVNHEFAETDVALVVGACDVVNPAAIERPDTPISGMPILNAHEARHVIVCNLDERPGYSGVENPLYNNPKTVLLFGDAQESVEKLCKGLSASA
ncbi:MAG TPA: NAD(P)(+) transhydrogenase (Re/Si-specific) subunit beta [Phycisphaerae bacterium]|nr:NAD(P)(+) transhydrogenase (Re/Si-specific) subunit beta [Phycisphaerae bacterium]